MGQPDRRGHDPVSDSYQGVIMKFTKRTYRKTRTRLTLRALAFRDRTEWLSYDKVMRTLTLLGDRARREKGMWHVT